MVLTGRYNTKNVARIIQLNPAQPPAAKSPKPDWLKVRAPGSPSYLRLKGLMRELNLHTVCEEAQCPNIGECWNHGTATFMILGDVCTRACSYCAVAHGRPGAVDEAEPVRVADAINTLALDYVVITSVDRDDLADGGASIFASTIREIRARRPECRAERGVGVPAQRDRGIGAPGVRIEVLIPDFQGNEAALRSVLDAEPDVLNHNTETVPRLYRMARSGGRYARTLELLDRSRRYAPAIPTKTGLMVGLGEAHDELVATFKDLRAVGCGILTIGQYLRPSVAHAPMVRYYHPDEFAELKRIALDLGFVHVESGPLVRSSYHAHETADAYERAASLG
jgi:lipoic acid synthetase